MYITKNALRSIWRSKGRNILIGIIALAIAVSACVALSIKESASKARQDTLNLMNITAQISINRENLMQSGAQSGENGETPQFDRDVIKGKLQSGNSLTLDEYETYAKASSVKKIRGRFSD